MRAGQVLLDLLFPPRCVFCGRVLGSGEREICAQCQRTLPWLTEEAAEQTGEFFDKCVSPLRYEGFVRDSIHRYKFKGMSRYAGIYGILTAQCVHDHLAGEYDLISWVPLSDRRKRERGYDQAFLLAQSAAVNLNDAAVETLRKLRDTEAQSGLEHDERRRANVLGAYVCTDPELVAGKRILLIDDVITTGATISECARTLLTAGAEKVVCATLARARSGR
ncbi:ComF family protein [uncultured Pseudoflavonifractor sp.]|uniref:ComF family protein n=1 Tax=uncultured Pseudoflavonifractor sp. TaxID=1221379 RepID=UPI0025F26D1B|nr:ComF family protein [uncultured Pseudoflavonifractor sp.]